jgi:hypothetical protein
MLFVDLWLPLANLAAQMGSMRIWLDRHGIETSGFSLTDNIARVAFREKLQAEAFALQFGGRVFPIANKRGDGELSETLPIAAPLSALAAAVAAARRANSSSNSGRSGDNEVRAYVAENGRETVGGTGPTERAQRNSNPSKTIRTMRPTTPSRKRNGRVYNLSSRQKMTARRARE